MQSKLKSYKDYIKHTKRARTHTRYINIILNCIIIYFIEIKKGTC